MKAIFTLTLAFILVAAPAMAQEQRHLDVVTTVQKEQVSTDADGERVTELVAAKTVVPGERVIYTITFRNISADGAENIVITNPIADSLTYVDGSAFGPGTDIQFSIDGGRRFAARAALTVVEDGIERPAEARDFTHIRWVMKEELGAGAEGIAQFAAVLD